MKLRIAFRFSWMVVLLLFVYVCLPVSGQKTANNAVTPQECTTISLTRKGTYLIVDAKLNGKIRKFVLDGSSDITLLNSKHIHQEPWESGKSKSAPEQPANRMNRKNNRIDFYGSRLDRPDLETMDMSYIENATGIKIYGIIGYDLIKYHDLVFNDKEQTILLFKPQKYRETRPTPPLHKRKTQWMLPFIPL